MLSNNWFTGRKVTSNSVRQKKSRHLRLEALESRALMASDAFHNFVMPNDVDDDGSVTPLDALVVINRINQGSDDSRGVSRRFHDADDDSSVSPLDALKVINHLNTQPATIPLRFEAARLPVTTQQVRARVELESLNGETELKIRVDNAPASVTHDVTLNDIALGQLVTDSRGRGQLVLSRGDDNRDHLALPTAIQSLSSEMEIVIGDIIRGPLGTVTKSESSAGGTSAGSSGSTNSASHEFVARFDSVAGVSRSAEFEQETENGVTKRKFKAQIEHAAPNTSYTVVVNGVSIGSVITNSRGKGSLVLTTQPRDSNDTPMTSDFPNVLIGTTISIGGLSSSFVSSAT